MSDRKEHSDARGQDGAATVRLAGDADLGPLLEVEEAHVTVTSGPGTGKVVPCGSCAVRIGSARDNDLVIADPAVSRHHAVLEPSAGQILLKDLDSTNGTFVAGVRVREAFVSAGSSIRIGQSKLELRLCRRAAVPASSRTSFGLLVGNSSKMRQLFSLLEVVAPTSATVLITGATGTGKELVARSLHESSPRKKGPFVVLDCGAADRDIISSELFGHEPGAFTGATSRRLGVFEQARAGTVFLDELGELPLDVQPKLLRVLEARELRRLGGNTTIPLDVRVVAATNRRLDEMVSDGRFRQDLYYRVCQVNIGLPALDERKEDIPLIVESFLANLSGTRRLSGVSPEALAHLERHTYPGNVRELRNLVERAAVLARGDRIELADLMLLGDSLPSSRSAVSQRIAVPTTDSRRSSANEREELLAALEAHGFNLTRTARSLGIVLNTLKARMQRLDIPRPGSRSDDS